MRPLEFRSAVAWRTGDHRYSKMIKGTCHVQSNIAHLQVRHKHVRQVFQGPQECHATPSSGCGMSFLVYIFWRLKAILPMSWRQACDWRTGHSFPKDGCVLCTKAGTLNTLNSRKEGPTWQLTDNTGQHYQTFRCHQLPMFFSEEDSCSNSACWLQRRAKRQSEFLGGTGSLGVVCSIFVAL